MDKHTPEQRKKNMQAVRNKDSKIEVLLRKQLWDKGYRYRKNYNKVIKKLPKFRPYDRGAGPYIIYTSKMNLSFLWYSLL